MPEGWSREVQPLDTERLLRALDEHEVHYVLVGGIAAIFHRWSGTTADADLVPAADAANLNRLGRTLHSLNAVVWADPNRTDLFPNGKPPEADDFGYTAEGLGRHGVWHLTSDAGLIDVVFEIDGVGGHQALAKAAERKEVFGMSITVASLEQIIASKRAVARPKDLRVLPELEELLENRRRRAVSENRNAAERKDSGEKPGSRKGRNERR